MAKVLHPEPEEHPSYGCVAISRITSGRGMSLFGSSIKHNNFVRLRICRADLRRQHHEDRHMAGDEIVEVDMSPVQFAEMIMSAGAYSGVPCTIRHIGRESIPEPRFDSKREQFVNEFRERTDDLASKFDTLIAEMAEMAEQGSASKKQRQACLNRLLTLKQEVESNMPFMAAQFNEQMDKTVHEAKGEVEAFVTNVVIKTGLENIRLGMLSLE